MMISPELLRRAIHSAPAIAIETYAPHLEAARQRFVGDDPVQVAMFLAQIAHESGSLRHVREIASGDAYEGRLDLGNTQPGDGPHFRGRGLLQVTGRANYEACGEALGLDLANHPWLLEEPLYAALSAGWVWQSFRLGELCNDADPVRAVTKRLNGGLNGLDDRRDRFAVALAAVQSTQARGTAPTSVSPSPTPPTSPAPPAPSPTRIEAPMALPLPILTGLIQAAATVLPEIGKLFLDETKSVKARNIEAATIALGKIADATKPADVPATEWNEQKAVAALVASPAAAKEARDALLDEYDRLLGMIVRAQEADDASMDRAAARAKGDDAINSATNVLIYGALGAAATVFASIVTLLVLQTIYFDDHKPMGELVALFIGTCGTVIGFSIAIYQYRFGSSAGSKASGDAVRSIAESRRA